MRHWHWHWQSLLGYYVRTGKEDDMMRQCTTSDSEPALPGNPTAAPRVWGRTSRPGTGLGEHTGRTTRRRGNAQVKSHVATRQIAHLAAVLQRLRHRSSPQLCESAVPSRAKQRVLRDTCEKTHWKKNANKKKTGKLTNTNRSNALAWRWSSVLIDPVSQVYQRANPAAA